MEHSSSGKDAEDTSTESNSSSLDPEYSSELIVECGPSSSPNRIISSEIDCLPVSSLSSASPCNTILSKSSPNHPGISVSDSEVDLQANSPKPCMADGSSSSQSTSSNFNETVVCGKRPIKEGKCRLKITDYLKVKCPRADSEISLQSYSVDIGGRNGSAADHNDIIMDFVGPLNENPNIEMSGENAYMESASSSVDNKETILLPDTFISTSSCTVRESSSEENSEKTLFDDVSLKSKVPQLDSPEIFDGIPNNYAFYCKKVMFGESYGQAIGRIRCADNRIYLCLLCQVQRENVNKPERYTLSVGEDDVQVISVYFGTKTSFLAIKPSLRFSQAVYLRIGRDILTPESTVPRKQYIILSLKQSFDSDVDACESLSQLIPCITPWTRLKILTQNAAEKFLSEVRFNDMLESFGMNNVETQTTLPLPLSASLNGSRPLEFKLNCKKAMFGELYGSTYSPIRFADNRIYLYLKCFMMRNNVPIPEKYTLSVGQNDVQQILAYFGHVPSFLAIETSTRFAEVACRRIGKEVLVPGSLDQKKRYVILALDSAFRNMTAARNMMTSLVKCLSPWARLNILTFEAAQNLINQSGLEVDQIER